MCGARGKISGDLVERGVLAFAKARRGIRGVTSRAGCAAHFIFRSRKRGCCCSVGGVQLSRVYREVPHTYVGKLICLRSMSATGSLLVKGAVCVRSRAIHISSTGDCSNCQSVPVSIGARTAIATIKINDRTCPIGVVFGSARKRSCCLRITLSQAGSNVSVDSFRNRGEVGCFSGSVDFAGGGLSGVRDLGGECLKTAICPGGALSTGETISLRGGRVRSYIRLPQCAVLAVGRIQVPSPNDLTVLALGSGGKVDCRVGISLGCSMVAEGGGCVRSLFKFRSVRGGCPNVARGH